MSKTETGKIENAKTARLLRDEELDSVNGGYSFGASNPYVSATRVPPTNVWLDIVVWG